MSYVHRNSKVQYRQNRELGKGEFQHDLRRYSEKQPEQWELEDRFSGVCEDGRKWWSHMDARYFQPLERKDYVDCRDLTTSDRMLRQFPSEPRLLGSYAREQLIAHYDPLAEQDFLHVLFKSSSSSYVCLATYELQPAPPTSVHQALDKEQISNFKITPLSTHPSQDTPIQAKMSLVDWTDDPELCRKAETLKKIACERGLNTIDGEIQAWESELVRASNSNNVNWNVLVQSIRTYREPKPIDPKEIVSIKQKLMWATMLKYFEHGYADKTQDMLTSLVQYERPMKSLKGQSGKNKFFQTDCKICFCSLNTDSNQVLYCDFCNTSFHLACYGLQEVPKEETYYCDCCQIVKNELKSRELQTKKTKCQLCCKPSFPMKRINQHFYHVTCLTLFNLVQIRAQTLAIKQSFTHEAILEMTAYSEIHNDPCIYCLMSSNSGGEFGIRFTCAKEGCKVSLHPICAYINGCNFDVKRSSSRRRLSVKVYCKYTILKCSAHLEFLRDHVEQAYLRRYMCDFKSTSNIKLHEFREIHEKENAEANRRNRENGEKKEGKSEAVVEKSFCSVERLITKPKVVCRYLQAQMKSPNEIIQTQSGKILAGLNRKYF